MSVLYETTIREVGCEARDLLDQGVLILFALGAPPELAEISVLHEASSPAASPPVPGDALQIGADLFRITAVGDTAWQKVGALGHVVFSFNGAASAERPGEICVEPALGGQLRALLRPGTIIAVLEARTARHASADLTAAAHGA